ncbi:MAG: hypothetical protein ABIH83_03785 [Candidatus Micrarchaeota archaeon]
MAMRQFILKRKPTDIILCLKNTEKKWYPSNIAKESGTSYVYVTNWLAKLEKAGWVKFEKKGRLKMVVLSEQGADIASLLDELVKKMEAHEKEQERKEKKEEEGTTKEVGGKESGIGLQK